jgi:hypothetical protein
MEENMEFVRNKCKEFGASVHDRATQHLRDEQVSYPRHCGDTMFQGAKALLASLAYVTHAIFPFVLKDTGNNMISNLSDENKVRDLERISEIRSHLVSDIDEKKEV